MIEKSNKAFLKWRQVPVKERAAICTKFVEAFKAKKELIAKEILNVFDNEQTLGNWWFGGGAMVVGW